MLQPGCKPGSVVSSASLQLASKTFTHILIHSSQLAESLLIQLGIFPDEAYCISQWT